MKKVVFIFLLLCLFSLNSTAQNKPASTIKPVPENFKGGCSMFPDGAYLDCCVEHDKAYYVGGSWTKRWRADKKLFKCVANARGWYHKIIAPVMWIGVRIGGVSWLPTPFRWGFGQKKSKNSRKLCESKCQNILTAK